MNVHYIIDKENENKIAYFPNQKRFFKVNDRMINSGNYK